MDWKEFMVFDLGDEGEKTQVDINKTQLGDYLNPEKVFLVINQNINRIYLWKGARSTVRKRFLGSRIATVVQGDIMKAGLKRCKVMSVDQGEEPDEFLNVFGLESMEVKEEDKLEDQKYIRNIEKEEMRIAEIKETKLKRTESTKLNEIKKLFSADEKILWIKSSTLKLTDNWLKVVVKDKRYRGRLKKTKEAQSIEIKDHEIRYMITNKRIISYHIFNSLYDFNDIPKYVLELNGDIALLNLNELRGFEIEESNGEYNIWFHSNPEKIGNNIFLFENLSFNEYEKFIEVSSANLKFRAEIPEKLQRLSYVKMKK
ncbi:MAG: hypothetical protein ACFFBP_05805 [Promethearchaeota archaeon]